ncbi:uncharacterized protein LOC123699752 [Colias croceus]|uniref:uncharacterized protein LOC123699752 n=1 Tax=Colias crocea TaxID=72248 RepID=UPI001E27A2C1|nr:uncharacterized protein LOC123699752 [Colias croceus]
MSNINVLDSRYFQRADQSDAACFFYPNIPLGRPVIFPGQCDPNINVVASLNLNDFQGPWYLIQTYYAERQSGSCNRARYTLNGTVLNLENSHVVNQSRLSVSGTATSPTGNGKLLVNIGTNPVVNYWIIGTNYNSYALAYSCENLDSERRRVWSWKLSRSPTMSNADTQVINNLMSNINVLDDRYFQNTNQTDAACFYYPDIPLEEPVIFPGQCDQTLPVVTNFNITAFLGTWHLMATYYDHRQSGTCNVARYSMNGNVIQLVNSHVVNGTQLSTSGTAVASADGSAKLRVTIGNNNVDYWILATDYNDYALAYSCTNLENNYRRVYSWKLSRTKNLTQTANNAMNNVINNINVLDERYYQSTNQTDAGCFHLPEFAAGQKVVLPGQCDENIPVVAKFDVEKYSGTWYQIQRYPQVFENGSCTGARYTLNGDVVTVLNWQRVNGELDTIEGNATIISADQSAKLRVVLPSRAPNATPGQTTSFDLYVLDTDYETYSLAYSCVNTDAYHRAIGAWKLSRRRTMSPAGNNAIDCYMENRMELENRYFIDVEQNDSCPEPSSAMLFKSSVTVLCALFLGLLNLS